MEEISSLFEKFRVGIEKGDQHASAGIVSEGPFSPLIRAFYRMLQKAYAGRAFPMEVHRVKILKDGRAKVLAYLTEDRERFVFTLDRTKDGWKISHLETMLIPLYSTPSAPYGQILRLDERQRTWISSEQEVDLLSRTYKELKEIGGKQYAQRFFLDGARFKLSMDAWLPFIEGAAQFVLFTAVIETNIRGSRCTVMQADEVRGELVMDPLAHLEVVRTGFFQDKMTEQEYKELYVTIMEDRAKHCGLDISIDFKDTRCTIVVTARPGAAVKVADANSRAQVGPQSGSLGRT